MQCTHIAYGDESFHNQGRYRSIAIVTLEADASATLSQTVRSLLDESGVKEFKWQKLRQARERFTAEKLLDFVIEQASRGAFRVDVLTWDTEDSRHKIKGRDDTANLQRMYYHLFKNALKRWPGDNTWILYPDQNSALDWESVQDYLDMAGLPLSVERHSSSLSLWDAGLFRIRLSHEFRIEAVQEVDSRETPLCQVADLLAGLSVFSRKDFNLYSSWRCEQQGQLRLFSDGQPINLTNSERERCRVLAYLNGKCKAQKLGVSLETRCGLWTPNPASPINFWFYEPQHPEDKAPIKQ